MPLRSCVGWLICGFCFLGAEVFAADGLSERLLPLIDRHQGDVSVAVKHLDSGESFAHQADEVMPAASLIKLAVMVEAYSQAESKQLALTEIVELKANDKVQGSGILTSHFSNGLKLPLRDCVRLMIAYSDNTATNLVVDRIGLPRVSQRMEALRLNETKLHAKVFHAETSIAPERSKQYGLGSTTANEMLRLLELIQRRELVSKEASEAMLDHLRACQDKNMLARNLPEGVKLAHKTGAVTGVRTTAGIIESEAGPIAVCVLTRNNKDKRWADDDAGSVLCSRIAREVFFHFNENWKDASPPKNDPLKLGDSGAIVESLQRTLNLKLKLSPELGVDGEFGPATHSAVIKFQKDNSLATTGIVDEAVWKLLGPLVSEAEPVPDPAAVNAETSPKQAADDLDGAPFVTAKAWAIGDARTGKVLWGSNESEKLEMASVTKVMTAWLIVRLADQDEKVLDETVTFSKRADRTIGSSSGVNAGEKLPVRDLLYGLLLPSGNDAAVALGEHFGARVGKGKSEKKPAAKSDPLAPFVAEMNAAAVELGMLETRFKNPHGLPDSGHNSSARDLVTLGWNAMQSARFRTLVQTRQHGCQVSGPGGYRRNLKWKNTNELLDIEGYEGLKTGTTDAAGACLMSQCVRGNDRLMLVVLGSTSSKSRYADSRNLYRWGWQQRGK